MQPKYWAITLLATATICVSVIYYLKQSVPYVGPVVVHHVVKSDTATSSLSSTASSSAEDISGWQTYTNSQYGFELKYPNDNQLVTDKNIAEQIGFGLGACQDSSIACFMFGLDKFPNTNFDGAGLSVNIAQNSGGSAIKTAQDCLSAGSQPVTGTETVNGVKFNIFNSEDGAGMHLSSSENYFTFINNECFDININTVTVTDQTFYKTAMTDSMKQWLSGVFDQMLSTFQFTQTSPPPTQASDDTSGWKIYSNSPYGFSFQYPSEWITSNEGASQTVYFEAQKQPGMVTAGDVSWASTSQYLNFSSLNDYITLNFDNIISRENKIFNSITWTIIESQPKWANGQDVYDALTLQGNNLYTVYAQNDKTDRDLFNQILSTFKFTN